MSAHADTPGCIIVFNVIGAIAIAGALVVILTSSVDKIKELERRVEQLECRVQALEQP